MHVCIFLLADKPQFKSRPRNVQADNGNHVSIMCDVDSNPPASIEWSFEKTKKVSVTNVWPPSWPRLIEPRGGFGKIVRGEHFCPVSCPSTIFDIKSLRVALDDSSCANNHSADHFFSNVSFYTFTRDNDVIILAYDIYYFGAMIFWLLVINRKLVSWWSYFYLLFGRSSRFQT